MGSVNISIKEEAYRFLKSLKSEGQSFSDVILQFKKGESDVMRFFGVLKDVDWDKRKKNMSKLREEFEKRL